MSANAKNHKDAKELEAMPKCEYCDRIFPSRSALVTHDRECVIVDIELNNCQIAAMPKATSAYGLLSTPILASARIR